MVNPGLCGVLTQVGFQWDTMEGKEEGPDELEKEVVVEASNTLLGEGVG